MTERMQRYRKKMEEKGLVQVRVWVEKQDEEFVKFIAQFCRGEREQKEKKSKERFGRRASDHHIRFARKVAAVYKIPEPDHLYDHHISLCAWIARYKGGKH